MRIFSYFKGGNIGLVARNLAYIHERIKMDHGDRIEDTKSILRLTAAVDLPAYIQLGQISIEMINDLIDKLRDDDAEYDTPGCFNDFVFQIEKLIFSFDSPHNVWVMDENSDDFNPGILMTIMRNIRTTQTKIRSGKLRRSKTEALFDQIINNIITHPEFEEMREILGI